MRLKEVNFDFQLKTGKLVRVTYFFHASGKPDRVSVYEGEALLLQIDNHTGIYKPCATHSRDILRLIEPKPTANNFEHNRRTRLRKQKPQLKITEG